MVAEMYINKIPIYAAGNKSIDCKPNKQSVEH